VSYCHYPYVINIVALNARQARPCCAILSTCCPIRATPISQGLPHFPEVRHRAGTAGATGHPHSSRERTWTQTHVTNGRGGSTYCKVRELLQQKTAVNSINKSPCCRARHCFYILMGSPPGKKRRNDASFRSSVSTALRTASTCTLFFTVYDRQYLLPNWARKRRRRVCFLSARATVAVSTSPDTKLSASSPQRAANKSRGGMRGSRTGSSASSAAMSNVAMGFSSTKCTQLEMSNSLQMSSEEPGSTCPTPPLPPESCAIRGPPCTDRTGSFRSAREMRMTAAGGVGWLAPQTPINDSLKNRRWQALRSAANNTQANGTQIFKR